MNLKNHKRKEKRNKEIGLIEPRKREYNEPRDIKYINFNNFFLFQKKYNSQSEESLKEREGRNLIKERLDSYNVKGFS